MEKGATRNTDLDLVVAPEQHDAHEGENLADSLVAGVADVVEHLNHPLVRVHGALHLNDDSHLSVGRGGQGQQR